jgi:PAS domain-containing protein
MMRRAGARFASKRARPLHPRATKPLIGRHSQNTMTNRTPPTGEMSEERSFQLLVAGIRDYAIFMLDPDGFIKTWNAGAQRFKGYTAGE